MNAQDTPRAMVRTYRHGLGDCHLVTLNAADGSKYRILIDCGVIVGTRDAEQRMTDVLENVYQESGGHVDLLVATHEHWDHLSGFLQAEVAFDKLKVSKVWMSWIENPRDEQAQTFKRDQNVALQLVRTAALQLDSKIADDGHPLASLLGFFGIAGRLTTASALEKVRTKADSPRYCDPKDKPALLQDFNARIYVLGPPRDPAMLRKTLPSKRNPETYSLTADSLDVMTSIFMGDAESPFVSSYRIPMEVARQQAFFQHQYWNEEDWRRVDSDYLGDATELAIALDNMTNNTSLVLAIELVDNGDVLLFAADAQVGNWLSWSDCSWTIDGQNVTGTDLLKRTVYYKVGHHGSLNATLKEKGLALMERLKVAVVPVDHAMAVKKNWGKLPLPTLVAALEAATRASGSVLRTDMEPAQNKNGIVSDPLYFDVPI
ncbi:hypothetical protein K788_0001820 (plasmid) [Paraburkholderia caribensis MBA4]|uniref:Metallo-beta-lactamase domain-containing protein n=1 Tax=Paraburkholderia caribensis MBA4 TaxID=1323664 RepID=A0A0P0RQQ2_9BURK|nr:hypothetical protein [Paraburkholderia caribensis]ALL71379.1 hypothetical protein K788_0001820 [Paraburkholderia caribensis MBA4]